MAPDGRKIQHSHERRRSQEVIDRILGNDRKKKTEDDIDVVAKKLKKISHNFLFGKSIEELKSSDELGIRTNSLYVKIDANDLFNKLL